MMFTAFAAVHVIPINEKGLPPTFEGAPAHADLTAGTHQFGASGLRFVDQFDRSPRVQGSC